MAKKSWLSVVGSMAKAMFLPKEESTVAVKSSASHSGGGSYRYIGAVSFNGEKNHGEMGPIKDYVIDYEAIRQRSWQLYLESEIAQTVLGKFNTWVIGKGLKLQMEPVKAVLEAKGLKVDYAKFSKSVESMFNLWKSTKSCDYSNMRSLNAIEAEAFKNSQVGGDCLVVLRIVKGTVKVQLIDASLLQSPMESGGSYPFYLNNGNKIVHGVEISPKGEHVAYHVRKRNELGQYTFETERIAARGARSGLLMAYLYFGHRYRIDSVRGMPALSVVMETAKKLERYKEATVGSAEERQKIAYTIEHQIFSTGENPLLSQMAIGNGYRTPEDDIAIDERGEQIANKFAATNNKQAYNLPLGATMKAVESKNELHFKDFYEVNIMLFCAAIEIPVDVALSRYNNSFSASRAALKDWEHTLNKRRVLHGDEFLDPIFELWFYVKVLQNEIDAPGYLEAFNESDEMVLAAYTNSRFVGAPVPHIDPLKEVNAERAKLGDAGANIPLTTVEASTESLNGGDSEANMEQFALELEKSNSLKIQPPPPPLDPNKQPRPVNKKEA